MKIKEEWKNLEQDSLALLMDVKPFYMEKKMSGQDCDTCYRHPIDCLCYKKESERRIEELEKRVCDIESVFLEVQKVCSLTYLNDAIKKVYHSKGD